MRDFATMDANALPVRIMSEDTVGGVRSVHADVDEYLPCSDLRVTPRVFASIKGVIDRLEAAREAGFRGSVCLGIVARNTVFNTVMLTVLGRLLPEVGDSSAWPVVRPTFRQVHPQAEVVQRETANGVVEVITSPSGQGWGAKQCRSTLRTRLIPAGFDRDEHVGGAERQVMTEELMLEAFDDALLMADMKAGEASGCVGR